MFKGLGYDKSSSDQLVKIYQEQASQKFQAGDFSLGKLDGNGQRINIGIEFPGIGEETGGVSYLKSGWMIQPDGSITLNTPFAGFMP
ncbi:hypothetical protein [Sulfoacidibacillus thermotolerans]|uniref:hypothetical protein n=1 Tax=Sulfoacidibacillus thermotolerans TaxID=1765684 RepID=UPI0011B21DE5|nr:hypothetical protein [Sulfoacidibacillus thermotolerans]